MQKIFIVLGIILLIIGLCYPYLRNIGIGNLPGDIFIKRSHYSFYFPLTTCLVLSLALSVLLWLFNK